MKGGRVVAVDHGTARSGTAFSDRGRRFAFPGEVFEGEEDLMAYLEGLRREEDLAEVVVGLPLNMDGTVGPRARDVLEFCERLRSRLGVEVRTWDERLTSFEAETLLRGVAPRGRRGRDLVDAVAAQRILQSYLASGPPGS